VRKGEGYDVSRLDTYDYKHLAFTFKQKKLEPFLVTVEPHKVEAFGLHTHEGQEFNYVLTAANALYCKPATARTLIPGVPTAKRPSAGRRHF
jgi:hypothetical protein